MPDLDPPPTPGRPSATGRGRVAAPDDGARGDDADPPTVRSATGLGAGMVPGPATVGPPTQADDPARPRPLPLPLPGDRVDVFELEESIGAGGMGAVFRAVDTRLDRHVALKILPPDQAVDPEVVLRYHQEGRAAARLDHENIARVYTIGDDGRYHYIAFEYIEGTTIRQRVEADGPLPVAEAIDYTLQIANALVHAADRGVVHRDIKPSNIIVTPRGRAKLVDMGLARRFERGEDAGLTQSGMTLGTFDYISPEQARDPRDVDVRGDLYSLGCTLFHMLSGRPPFPDGTVLQKLIQHQEEPPPDIRKLNPAVPDDLAAILVKLMAKDRDRRYQTPEQLVRDLRAVAGSLGLGSPRAEGRPWPAPVVAPAWVKQLVWGVPVLAFLVILAGLALWGDGPPGPRLSGVPGPSTPSLPPSRPPATRPPAAPRRPSPPAESEAPRELLVAAGEDLPRILAGAPRRSTILLSEKGPYDLRGLTSRPLSGLDLAIKAEPGVRPVIRLPRGPGLDASSPAVALLDIRGGRIALEGLEFVVDGGPGTSSGDAPAAAIRIEDAEVTIRRCSFRRPDGDPPRSRAAAILVRSTIRAGAGPAGERPATLWLDASEFDGGQAGVIATGPVEVGARDCSFGPAPADLATFWCDNPETSAVPAEFRLDHASILVGPGPVFRFVGTVPRVRVDDSAFGPPAAPPAAPPATLVSIDAPDRLDWRGADNLYARIAVYLRPGGARPQVRDFKAWADDPSLFRESGSAAFAGHPWEERNPLAPGASEPGRAYRLALPRSIAARPGARHGPSGTLPPPALLATATPPSPNQTIAALGPIARAERVEPARPREGAVAPPPPGLGDPAEDEMKQMPLVLPAPPPRPSEIRGDDPGALPSGGEPPPTAVDPERTPMPVAPPGPAAAGTVAGVAIPAGLAEPIPARPAADPAPIRTAAEFAEAFEQGGPGVRSIVLAADADLVLPSGRVRGAASVIRAERGATRPRVRFVPDPADPRPVGGWTAWLAVPSGGLRVEGVDLVLTLPAVDAVRPGDRPRAAFTVGSGATLSLTDCTVTIEGAGLRSAVVAVVPGEAAADGDEIPLAAPDPANPPPPARVRIKDCLLRVGDDLVDVTAGQSAEIEVDNAAVATGGALVHGHGQPRGVPTGPIKLDLRQVGARLAGGLALLQSSPGRPDLPQANLAAHETILATVDPETPLCRVDGQGDPDLLSDRIRWEGRSVAYHQIETYRRDQSARRGVLPNLFDRDSWRVAVGPREGAAIHGDLKFLHDWDPARPAWSLRPDDLRLRPESPAAEADIGPDLLQIPAPPQARAS